MKDWITDRITWLDANIPGTCNTTSVDGDKSTNDILVHVFPNPASEFVYFRQELKGDQITIKLFDNLGREVKSLRTDNKMLLAIGVHELQSGLYFYSIDNMNGIVYKGKIVVTH